MNKKNITIIVISSIIAILIIGMIVWIAVGMSGNDVSNTVEDGKNKVEDSTHIGSVEEYKAEYLEYIGANKDLFIRGMMLCDLNRDRIPELFSIAYDEKGDLVYYHEFKDGKVNRPGKNSVKTYINLGNLVNPVTFFESPENFLGIYTNKLTGENALINSVADASESDRFDIISFSGSKLIQTDNGTKYPVDNIWPIAKTRDAVMCNYEVSQEKLFARYLLVGEYGGESGADPVQELDALIDEFDNYDTSSKYDKAEDGVMTCYVRNIRLTNHEVEMVPVSTITYEEYNNAINADKTYTLNGELMSIKFNPGFYEQLGIAHLYQNPGIEYPFSIPTAESPESIIEEYYKNTPVRVRISKDLKVRYGVTGYNSDGSVSGYETIGRKTEYSIEDYLPNFAQYNMHSYYKAVIKDGELVYLDVMYHP